MYLTVLFARLHLKDFLVILTLIKVNLHNFLSFNRCANNVTNMTPVWTLKFLGYMLLTDVLKGEITCTWSCVRMTV